MRIVTYFKTATLLVITAVVLLPADIDGADKLPLRKGNTKLLAEELNVLLIVVRAEQHITDIKVIAELSLRGLNYVYKVQLFF